MPDLLPLLIALLGLGWALLRLVACAVCAVALWHWATCPYSWPRQRGRCLHRCSEGHTYGRGCVLRPRRRP